MRILRPSAARVSMTLALIGLALVSVVERADAVPLADGRAYEQVTPADKDFGFGTLNFDVGLSSATGASVAYDTFGPLPGAASGGAQNFYLGTRAAGGWGMRSITPPQAPIAGGTTYPSTQAFSPDLTKEAVVTANPPLTPEAPPDVGNLYIRDNSDGSYRLVTTVAGSPNFSAFLKFGGASADFTHIVFEGYDPLTPGAPGAGRNDLYESIGGALRLVGVLPDGTPAPYGAVLGAGASNQRVAHAVSDDGARIFFVAPNSGFGTSLYLRDRGVRTIHVSASKASTPDPNGPQATTFWAASSHGSKVFFTTPARLTDSANTGVDGSGNPTDAGNDLYLYEVDADRLTDLSVSTNSTDSATGANVLGVVGASDDSSYVYFVAQGSLAAGATSGMPNLYVWHDGSTRFIATLDPADSGNWGVAVTGMLTSRVTPDGRQVLLQSVKSLTGYDNTDPATGAPHKEVYLYEAASGDLRCVSCNPSGTRPVGDASVRPPALLTNIPRNLSDDGARVFFDSSDALITRDTNGTQDVYEWERRGTGDCGIPGGCVHLISSGTSRFTSSFQDASASGDDVLFATREQLVPQDTDDLVDLYDARVGGGFPLPAAPRICSGDNCRGQPSTPAGGAVAGSAIFTGPGNQPSARAATIAIRKISKSEQRRFARMGRVMLTVSVSAAGRISARARARLAGHFTTVASRSVRVRGGGTVRLTLKLSRAARRQLARHHRVTLRISVTYSRVRGSKQATVTLHR
jgi:hypothetical protein